MDIMNLLGGKKTTFHYFDPEKGAEGSEAIISLDACISENHTMSCAVTSHPIEDGSDVNDHVKQNPDTLSIEGVVSDTPITLLGALVGTAAGAVGGLFGGTLGAIATGATAVIGQDIIAKKGGKPSKTALEAFEMIIKKGMPVTITTGLKTYKNYILESFPITRNARTANSLRFTGSLKQVVIAVSELVKIPKSAIKPDARNSAAEKKSKGNVPAKDADSSLASRGSSMLSKIFGV